MLVTSTEAVSFVIVRSIATYPVGQDVRVKLESVKSSRSVFELIS